MEKKSRMDVFVDIETASRESNAAILSIAAIPFNRVEKSVHEPIKFYQVVNLASCFFSGMDFEKDTQSWWLSQNQNAKNEILNQDGKKWITEVLEMFVNWVNDLDKDNELYFWSQGTGFDFRILGHAIKTHLGVDTPWKYNRLRDSRTYILEHVDDYSDLPTTAEKIKHSALDDALRGVENILYIDSMKQQGFTAEFSVNRISQEYVVEP